MKTRITRTVASLALATALLSGSGAAFAATPVTTNPAVYDLGALGDLGVPVDVGSVTDVGGHVAGALDITNSATGAVPPILGAVEPIPGQAVSTSLGIASAATQGAGLPGLPFPLP